MRKRIRTVLKSLLILGVGCGSLAAQSGAADAYYVATNGVAPNDGVGWGTAFTQIQDALNVATPGDTIHLAGHTFELTTPLAWTNASDVTLLGGYEAVSGVEPGPSDTDLWPTVITRDSGVDIRLMRIEGIENPRIERVQFKGGRVLSTPIEGGALRALNVTNLQIQACRFTGNAISTGTKGINPKGGALYGVSSSGAISNTVFTGNTLGAGSYVYTYGGAMFLEGDWELDSVTVKNNRVSGGLFRNAYGGGLYLASGTYRLHNLKVVNNEVLAGKDTYGGGLYAVSDAEIEISNLTLADNCSTESALYNAGSQVEVRNSILYGNRGSDVRAGFPPTLSHCLVGDGTGAGSNGNFAADPLFETPLYYLSAGSPVTNAGDRSASSAGLDAKTTSREGALDAGTVDLGYHYAEGVIFDLDLYVTESGEDGNDGESPAQALRSITRALELAAPRTRIHVAAGQYTNGVETFPFHIDRSGIQILGAGSQLTVIDGAGAGSQIFKLYDTGGDTRIEGVTVTGGENTDTASGGGMYIEISTVALVDVVISDNIQDLSGEYNFGGGIYADKSSGIIENSRIIGNAGGLSGGWSRNMDGGGAWLRGTWTLRNMIVSENTASAGGISRDPQGGGLFLGSGIFSLRNVQVDRNTVDPGGGSAKGGAGIWTDADAHVTLENVTMVDNNLHGLRGVPGNTVRNSVLWDNGEADFVNISENSFFFSNAGGLASGVQGNLSEDPRFVDAGNGDYRLSDDAGSPCINAGEVLSWMDGAVDLAGNPRVMGGNVDMGAYETLPPFGTLFMIR